MKKGIKNNLKKATSIVLAGSLLAGSCTTPYVEPFDKTENIEDVNKLNSVILDLYGLEIEEEFLTYLNNLTFLTNKILLSEEEALSFSSNPQAYIEKNNLNILIDENSIEMKFLLALGDKDIIAAKKSGDIRNFIKLCEEKELLNLFENDRDFVERVSESIIGDEKLVNYFLKDSTLTKTTIKEKDVFVFPIAVVALAVVYYAVGFWTVYWGSESITEDPYTRVEGLWHHNPVNLKSEYPIGVIDSVEVTKIVDLIMENDVYQRYDTEKVRAFVANNLSLFKQK